MTHIIDDVKITPNVIETLRRIQDGGAETRIQSLEKMIDFLVSEEYSLNDPKCLLSLIQDCRWLEKEFVKLNAINHE